MQCLFDLNISNFRDILSQFALIYVCHALETPLMLVVIAEMASYGLEQSAVVVHVTRRSSTGHSKLQNLKTTPTTVCMPASRFQHTQCTDLKRHSLSAVVCLCFVTMVSDACLR